MNTLVAYARRAARWLWSHPHLLSALCLLAVITFVYFDDKADDRRANEQRTEAIDQFCRVEERGHLRDIARLSEMYVYLDGLPRTAYTDPLNAELIRSTLPSREFEAKQDPAPPICDEPGFGLKEPDPAIPQRPHDLTLPPFPPEPKTP